MAITTSAAWFKLVLLLEEKKTKRAKIMREKKGGEDADDDVRMGIREYWVEKSCSTLSGKEKKMKKQTAPCCQPGCPDCSCL